ncbi:MAG: DegT/DnrJ/EryC1/StrS family aminotransferase [bacterium]|nr:DegT/DnrJ/EryC1/StrS family aminotransferase [bacterium]
MKYKVPFVNYPKQYQDHKKEYLEKLDDVFSRGDLIMRKDLEEFERKFAGFVGTKYAVGVNSGTSAIYVALKAAGIGFRDEVITVAHTFIASISCIYLVGAKPVLVDIGEDFNMDVKKIESAVTKRTKAIEVVHLNGRLCDMEKIMAIAKKRKLLIIEDASQAVGAKMKMKNGEWKKAGSFGIAGCFSLYPAKILGAFGNAGVLATNNSEIAKKARLLRYNGEDRETRTFYCHSHNLLLDNAQAALLNVKMKYLPGWIKRRIKIANLYYNGLKDVPAIKLPHFGDSRFYDAYFHYVIRVSDRENLKSFLRSKGVETIVSTGFPNYRQPAMKPNKIFLKNTEEICKEVISLPMYPELTNEQAGYVINCVKEFYY